MHAYPDIAGCNSHNQMLTFFPKEDPKQSLRIRRLLMACGSYLMLFFVLLVAVWLRLLDLKPTLHIVTAGILFNLFLYGVIRSGFNLRFRDPSLTILQLIVPLTMVSYGMYFAGGSRSVFLMTYLVAILFGLFRLNTRQLLAVGVYALASFGAVIALSSYYKPDYSVLKADLMNWVVLGLILPWFALIGGHISNLRKAMRDKNIQLESALATIRELAMHDELTGSYNRHYLMDRMTQEARRSKRSKSTFCVCMIDIDFFKKINDKYGHIAGDKVLQIFAKVLERDLRTTDCFARYGGEEFVLLLPDTALESAVAVAERARRRIEVAGFTDLGIPPVTASFGVAQYQTPEDIDATLGRADTALYQAKSSGRNRVERAEATPPDHQGPALRSV